MQLSETLGPLREPTPGQPPARLVLHFHVVVTLGPVITDENQLGLPSPNVVLHEPEVTANSLMEVLAARHPTSGSVPSATSRGTVLTKNSTSSGAAEQCSPAGGSEPTLSPQRPRMGDPIRAPAGRRSAPLRPLAETVRTGPHCQEPRGSSSRTSVAATRATARRRVEEERRCRTRCRKSRPRSNTLAHLVDGDESGADGCRRPGFPATELAQVAYSNSVKGQQRPGCLGRWGAAPRAWRTRRACRPARTRGGQGAGPASATPTAGWLKSRRRVPK